MIEILCQRNYRQRMAICENYRQFLNRNLEKDVKGDTSGNFGTFMVALVRTVEDRDCFFLKKCTKGLGTDNFLLIEMLCTKESTEIVRMKEAYKRAFMDGNLEKDVTEDTSGDYGRLLVAVL
jgi:hypothetical protein